jgi:phosphatidylserine synthase
MSNLIGGWGYNGPVDWLFKKKCIDNSKNEIYFWDQNDTDKKGLKIIIVALIIILFGLLIMPLVSKFQGAEDSKMSMGFFIPAIVLTFFLIVALFMKCKSTRRFWIVIYGFGSIVCLMVSLFIMKSTYKFTTDQLINTILHFILFVLLIVSAWFVV